MKRKPKVTESPLDENSVGFYIRKFRREKGLTSDELGTLIGSTGNNVTAMERGVQYPKIQTRIKIAKALEIPSICLFPELEETYSIKIEKKLSDYSIDELLSEIKRRVN